MAPMPRFAPHVTLFLLACTLTVPGHAQQSIDDWPEWIQKIMAKEAGKRTMKPKTRAMPSRPTPRSKTPAGQTKTGKQKN